MRIRLLLHVNDSEACELKQFGTHKRARTRCPTTVSHLGHTPPPLINDLVDLPKLREEREGELGRRNVKKKNFTGFHAERERTCLQQLFSGYKAVTAIKGSSMGVCGTTSFNSAFCSPHSKLFRSIFQCQQMRVTRERESERELCNTKMQKSDDFIANCTIQQVQNFTRQII